MSVNEVSCVKSFKCSTRVEKGMLILLDVQHFGQQLLFLNVL